MDIARLTMDLDTALVEKYNEYVNVQEKLNPFRGKILHGDDVHTVNAILQDIQNTFNEMHPALNMIGYRYQWACNLANAHTILLDQLVKNHNKEIDGTRQ